MKKGDVSVSAPRWSIPAVAEMDTPVDWGMESFLSAARRRRFFQSQASMLTGLALGCSDFQVLSQGSPCSHSGLDALCNFDWTVG